MKDYLQLTPQGKARRLRRMVFEALKNYDLDVRKVSLITNEQNGIFRVDADSGEKFIMRVSIPDGGHTVEQIKSEMLYLNALKEYPHINAPVPVQAKSGKWVVTVEVDGVPQPRHCVMFSWIPGVDLADRRSPETWYYFGLLSAQLHQFASQFTPPANFNIYIYDSIFAYSEDCVLLNPENRGHFTDEEFALLQHAIETVQADIDSLHRDTSQICVTHGDLHHWNVRIARGKLSPIDFEDLIWAHPIQDIATTLYYNRYDEQYDALLKSFKNGYETVNQFPETYPGQLETHMLARRLSLLNYVFVAEEVDISEFPNFIPLTMERIRFVQDTVWNKNGR